MAPSSWRLLDVLRQLRQHRNAAADMKAADHDRQASRAELSREVERRAGTGSTARRQGRRSRRRPPYPLDDALDVDDRVALVIGFDLDLDVGSESAGRARNRQSAHERSQGCSMESSSGPLDDIAVAVVVRRLDKDDPKFSRVRWNPMLDEELPQ